MDPNQRYKLSLASNPRNLGRNSRNQGLGVYFLTGIFLLILLIALSLISIYPTADNAASAHQAVRPVRVACPPGVASSARTFTSAPASIRTFTSDAWPLPAARCKTVKPVPGNTLSTV